MSFRVSPIPRSIGCAFWWISGSPRLPHPPAAPYMRPQASLNPAYTVGSMMTPLLNRTLHPRTRPRMNLRLNQVFAHSRLTLDANFNRFSIFGSSQLWAPNSNPHRSVTPELRSQFPCGSPTDMDVRTVRPVEASAKNRKICGFHRSWCKNRRGIAPKCLFGS